MIEVANVVAVLTAATAVLMWRRHRIVLVAAMTVPVILGAAQLAMTTLRWQTGLAAAATVLVVGAASAQWRRLHPATTPLAVTGAIVSLLAGFAIWALPVPSLAAPDGRYPVGTTTFWLTDPDRQEAWGTSPSGPRRVTAHLWYPATDTSDELAAWLPDARMAGPVAESFGLPRVVASHLPKITGYATRTAPVADDGPFPLLIFSHGWSGFAALHSPMFEQLASHGWMVVALDHPFGALTTVLADGTTAQLDGSVLPDTADEQQYAQAARDLVATFAADIELAFRQYPDRLDDDLVAAIDPYRVAVAGHSTGGGAAILVCSRSRWCDAVVGYDPWVEPVPDEVIGAGMAVPVLSVRSHEWTLLPNDQRLRRLHAGTSAPEGRIAIDATVHRDFTLVPQLSPLVAVMDPVSRSADNLDTQRIVDRWTLDFLNRHVRGVGLDPLRFPPDEPRVSVATR